MASPSLPGIVRTSVSRTSVRDHRHSSGEYVRTRGHYHPLSPSGIGYPELYYQVFAGEVLSLLQRSDPGDIVAAKAGEFVLILPGYDHQPGKGVPACAAAMAGPTTGAYRSP